MLGAFHLNIQCDVSKDLHKQYSQLGATSIMIHYPPYYGAQKTIEMLRLFAKEVLPNIRDEKKVAAE